MTDKGWVLVLAVAAILCINICRRVSIHRRKKRNDSALFARTLLSTAIDEKERAYARHYAASIGLHVSEADDAAWREQLREMTAEIQKQSR